MKKFTKILIITVLILGVVAAGLFLRLKPVWELAKIPTYHGQLNFKWTSPALDSSKKTIIIIADNDGTEIFDLLSPFYLFNATGKANVLIISEKKFPVTLTKGLFILPHFTFAEADSLGIHPDVMVIPNQSVMPGHPQKSTTVNWIRNHYTGKNIILSICDGAATAAATGLYDGKPLTAHASDLHALIKQYPLPAWVKNVSVTENGNFFSTAGVSNATEGSLSVINKLFGSEVKQNVMRDVQYPYPEIKKDHESIVIHTDPIVTGISKVLFRKNYTIGVLLQHHINEFQLASIIDTYTRSFPASIETFVTRGTFITSKYGLSIYPTSNNINHSFDEVHILMPESFSSADGAGLKTSNRVTYDEKDSKYYINRSLDRISNQYGTKFQHLVKLMLDYN